MSGTGRDHATGWGTRRSYGVAINDFARWLARKLKIENPLKDFDVPGQYENPE